MKRKNEKKAMVGMLIVATMIGTLANPVNISANEGGGKARSLLFGHGMQTWKQFKKQQSDTMMQPVPTSN